MSPTLLYTGRQLTFSRVQRFIANIQNKPTQKHTNPVNLENSSFEKSLWASPPLVILLVSPLSRGEDGVGVAVSFPLLLPLLLAVRGQSLLQLLVALEEIATRAHDVLLDFAVPLHV